MLEVTDAVDELHRRARKNLCNRGCGNEAGSSPGVTSHALIVLPAMHQPARSYGTTSSHRPVLTDVSSESTEGGAG
jgi:hypothetical protein